MLSTLRRELLIIAKCLHALSRVLLLAGQGPQPWQVVPCALSARWWLL